MSKFQKFQTLKLRLQKNLVKSQLHNFRSSFKHIKNEKVAACEKQNCRKISSKRTGTARHLMKEKKFAKESSWCDI